MIARRTSDVSSAGGDTEAVLLAAGLIFLWRWCSGVWKYVQMDASPEGLAHPYVDTAHRAALLYSFATLLIAVFVELSAWSETGRLDRRLRGDLLLRRRDRLLHLARGASGTPTTSSATRVRGTGAFIWSLVVAEIGGFAVLLAGFVDAQIL